MGVPSHTESVSVHNVYVCTNLSLQESNNFADAAKRHLQQAEAGSESKSAEQLVAYSRL